MLYQLRSERALGSQGDTSYELLEKDCKEGLARIYTLYGKKLYGYAIRNWNLDEDDAWDMVYKTLYKVADVHEKYDFDSEKKFASFLFKIFMNYLRNLYRDKKRMAESVSFTPVDMVAMDGGQALAGRTEMETKKKLISTYTSEEYGEPHSENPLMTKLKQELDTLDEWQRILLLMRCQDIPYQEIARYVDKPAKQLKVYYLRLKEKLIKELNSGAPSGNMVTNGK